MAETLRELLKEYDNKKYATDVGTNMHKKLRILGVNGGDYELSENIKKYPDLAMFFTENARTEVPIAANINGVFVSRRIDRLVIDDENKVIHILDYKTDVDKSAYHSKYVAQVREYMAIMCKIYPKYRVLGYILWIHDWSLEKL